MRRIANWTNLSETTFFQSPSPESGADYLPAHLHAGERAAVCGPPDGRLRARLPRTGRRAPGPGRPADGVRRGGPRAAHRDGGRRVADLRRDALGGASSTSSAPPSKRFGRARSAIVSADPPPASIDNGPVWLFTLLGSSAELARAQPDMAAVAGSAATSGSPGSPLSLLTGLLTEGRRCTSAASARPRRLRGPGHRERERRSAYVP